MNKANEIYTLQFFKGRQQKNLEFGFQPRLVVSEGYG